MFRFINNLKIILAYKVYFVMTEREKKNGKYKEENL